jgi:hypothetical protein
MPDSVPNPVQEATAASMAPERRKAIDIVADAYTAAFNDAEIRTSHDAAKRILEALKAAGHQPLDFRGKRKLDFDAIEMALHSISTTAVKVEMIGQCAVDDIHSEKLGEVFDSVRADLEEQVAHLKAHLGLTREVHS